MPGTPPVRLIGDGQLGDWLDDELRRDRPPGFEHVPWVEYERLGEEIAAAGICWASSGAARRPRGWCRTRSTTRWRWAGR